MRNETFVKSMAPEEALLANSIVKLGAADEGVLQAEAGEGIGVTNDYAAAATDDTVDVVFGGIARVVYGGTVTRGAWLTADANGKAVATTTAGDHVIGRAMLSGVAGDIGSVLLGNGTFAAAA